MNKDHKQAAQNLFLSSVTGLANVVAVVTAFFCTGPFYHRTIGFIDRYVENNYGYGWEDITHICWWIVTALIVFFLARMSVGLAIMMGGIYLITRFF